MKAHVSSILLGVEDMDRSKRFYTEGLCSFADPDGYVWNIGFSARGKNQPYAE
jgi:predicted lactoylglutathione lyase